MSTDDRLIYRNWILYSRIVCTGGRWETDRSFSADSGSVPRGSEATGPLYLLLLFPSLFSVVLDSSARMNGPVKTVTETIRTRQVVRGSIDGQVAAWQGSIQPWVLPTPVQQDRISL